MPRAAWLALLAGCAHSPLVPERALTPPHQLCGLSKGEFCLPARRMERLLKDAPLQIMGAGAPGRGIGGAYVVVLSFPREKLTVRAKWKPAEPGGGGFNKSPRRELAAYALQKLFASPGEYVVPPTVMRCLPTILHANAIDPKKPNIAGSDCVMGTMSYWIEGVEQLAGIDGERYARDPRYRAAMARLNVLTYLVDHRDTRPSNFVISSDRKRPRAFAVDNGLSFSGVRNPRAYLMRDWSEIIVDALPADTVGRLRRITRADLERLLVVAQFEIRDGFLEPVPPGAPFDEHQGVRRRGNLIQWGLTREELEGVALRLQRLLLRLERGELAVFETPSGRDRHTRHGARRGM